jgi:hypothetical protein
MKFGIPDHAALALDWKGSFFDSVLVAELERFAVVKTF